jgi:hypothetical protein|uniref:Uncharacterized protein n=1 Tax=Myoviridae sp. ctshb19 TaxID=2825194 RepID=A0A8S5UGW5_9CAUD|nr:MAG TPA: hypothetical protein [Myoviridae sp. ctshb19]
MTKHSEDSQRIYDTAQGKVRAIMQSAKFRKKLPALLAVAEFLDTAEFIKDNGEEITVQALHELRQQIEAYKLQLPFLMNLKPGTSADCTASSLYEDVYNAQCEIFGPHVLAQQLGSRIQPDSLCNSVVENTEALLKFWLANRDTAKHPLGE